MELVATLSIKKRIVIVMFIAIVISCSILMLVSQSKSKQLIVSRLENSELPNLVQRIRNAVDSEVLSMKVLTHAIAKNPLLLKWIENGASKDNEQYVVDYLKVVADDNNFSNASFADRDTYKYWNQNGFLKVLEKGPDDWFFSFRESGKSESASVFQETDGRIDIYINYQQLNGRGVAGVSKSFKGMVDYLDTFKIEQSGFVYLVDSSGEIKVHKQSQYNGNKNIEDIYEGNISNSLLQKSHFSFAVINELVVATSYIESLDWYVVAQVPVEELFLELNNAQTDIYIIFAVIILIFFLLSLILANNLVKPIERMSQAFQDLGEGEGDLTSRVSENEVTEIAELAKGFNRFVEKIHLVITEVATTSSDINGASHSVNQDAQSTKLALDNQRDEAHQVSVAIEQMGTTIADVAENAGVAAQTTNDASDKAVNAQSVVTESTSTINQMADDMEVVSGNIEILANKSDAISSVLDVIRGISEQTNLLALNAAIEAARAGEQGRGFAVVADEVRSLAHRTNESTDEIHQMITELQGGAKDAVDSAHKSREQAALGVEAARKTSHELNEIVENIRHISDLNTQIATATEQQSAVINEINVHVVNISDGTEQSASASGSIEQSSEELKQMANNLDELVRRFKT